MGSSLALSCNIRLFVIELDYGYRYLLEVFSELSSICFLSWLSWLPIKVVNKNRNWYSLAKPADLALFYCLC